VSLRCLGVSVVKWQVGTFHHRRHREFTETQRKVELDITNTFTKHHGEILEAHRKGYTSPDYPLKSVLPI